MHNLRSRVVYSPEEKDDGEFMLFVNNLKKFVKPNLPINEAMELFAYLQDHLKELALLKSPNLTWSLSGIIYRHLEIIKETKGVDLSEFARTLTNMAINKSCNQYKEWDEATNSDPNWKCGLCQTGVYFGDPVKPANSCGHVFHNRCYTAYIQYETHNNCRTCLLSGLPG